MSSTSKPAISQTKIARDLGYSQSLVSRVLNGQHAFIPDDTVKAIWDYAREHGYRPRGINLDMLVAETVATQMVGLVLRSPLRLVTESQVFQHAHQGMHDYLSRRNIRTVYFGAEDELDAGELVKTVERQKLVRGLVLMGEVQLPFATALSACSKPVVIVSARHPGVCHSVVSNLNQAAALLVEHLCKLGHQRFGWIGRRHHLERVPGRKDALMQSLKIRGLKIAESCQFDMPEADRHNGFMACKELFTRQRRNVPTALVCHNAMMARGAVNHLFQRGLHVPRDVSVVAFDMTQVCVEEPPHITSAAASPEALGARAAQLIVERSEKPDGSLCEVSVPSELIVRETTARPRQTSRRRT